VPIYGLEWIIVGVIVLVLFLWGPEKLPKFARSIGQAKKEFEKASKTIEEEISRTTPTMPTVSTPPAQTGDDKIIEIAKSLGIQTEGKTRDQLFEEILSRTQKTS